MTDWAKLTVVDLKEELKSRGLQLTGRKADLVARLHEDDEQAQKPEEKDDAPAPVAEESDLAVDQSAPPEIIETAEIADMPDATDHDAAEGEATQIDPDDDVDLVEAPTDAGSGDAGVQDVPQTEENSAPMEHEPPRDEPVEQPKSEEPTTIVQDPISTEANTSKADKIMADPVEDTKTTEVAPQEAEASPKFDTPETTQEAQKRKRRSLSPPPTEESISRKRARAAEDSTNGDIAPVVRMVDEDDMPEAQNEPEVMDTQEGRDAKEPADIPPPHEARKHGGTPEREPDEFQREAEYERDVAPAVHPATCALYIKNLMRPVRQNEIQAHLVNLATQSVEASNSNIIVNLYLDQLRTHAFVVFKSTSAASRVRTALHDVVWPDESNRKPLWVDFVPPEKVQGWIETEETSGGGRLGSRWEVVYEDGPDGSIEAFLESGNTGSKSGSVPSGRAPLGPTSDSIPTGPRTFRDNMQPPTGPRPVRPGTGPGPRPPPSGRSGSFDYTNTRPVIEYQKVSEDLAARRIDAMRSFYTRDAHRDLGRDINRYSFEEGDKFVDRGKEIFEGIRPPHRERAVQQERHRGGRGFGGGGRRGGRGGGGGGGGRFRPRSDRYLPGMRNDRDGRWEREPARGRLGGYAGGGGGGGGGRWD